MTAGAPDCYHRAMTFFRTLLFVCPVACLLAQTPPPKRAQTPPPKPAASKPVQAAKPAPAPQPTVTMSTEQAPPIAAMPVLPPDRVVISVGDQKMTYAEFDAILNSLPEQYRASAKGAGRKQFADSLVRVMVLAQEGRRRKLDESMAFKTQAAFQTQNVLAASAMENIGKTLQIEEADVRKYYEAHKAEFEQVHARHILIRAQGSQVPVRSGQKELTDAEALAKAQELRKKLVGGADFATIAMAESDDTSSGAKGGDLGTFRKGQMVPTFEQAAFTLKPGELSEPVKSQFGYHLIKVESHENKTYEQAKGDLETRMRPELLQKYMAELQQKTSVLLDPELFPVAPTVVPPPPGK